jgi:hypothetical protein
MLLFILLLLTYALLDKMYYCFINGIILYLHFVTTCFFLLLFLLVFGLCYALELVRSVQGPPFFLSAQPEAAFSS